jgi:hypothetical protein
MAQVAALQQGAGVGWLKNTSSFYYYKALQEKGGTSQITHVLRNLLK